MDLPDRQADAVAHLEKAVMIQPDSPEAHVNLGMTLAGMPGRSQQAIAHLEIALAIRPDLQPVREILDRLRAGGHK